MSDDAAGRLSLVGLGLEEDGISRAGLQAARRTEHVFLEAYTAKSPQPVPALEQMVEGEVVPLDRAAVEDGTVILEAAEGSRACLLVAGDPLSATTHTALRLQAREAGIAVAIHHAGSVLTAAAGALGLSHYKFGRTTTLVTPREGYFPDSPYDVIEGNLAQDLHTLVLLDVREDGSFMTVAEGTDVLERLEQRRGEGVLEADRDVLAVARAGREDARAWRGSLAALGGLDAGAPMHSIVVPGPLSAVEAEALEAFVTPVNNG